MPILRSIFSSYKHRSLYAYSHLRRFGPSKSISYRSYSNSSRNGRSKLNGRPVVQEGTRPRSSPSWGSYAIPAAAVLGFAGFAGFLYYNDQRRVGGVVLLDGMVYYYYQDAVWQGPTQVSASSAAPIIGGPFSLVNTEGKTVTEKDLRGNWVLLYFGYTSSPDVGPEQVQMIAKAIDMLESKENLKVLPIVVSIDPQRDTPAQLRAYLKEFDPRIVGLTGPANAVRQMAQEYRVFFRKVEEEGDDYLVETSHNMYLMNPRIEVVRCFGVEYAAEEMTKEILKEMLKSSS